MKKILKLTGIGLLLLIFGIALTIWFKNEPLPAGVQSPEADTLTKTIYTQLNKTAWDSTDWVQWTFRTGTTYVWDKNMQRVQVRWSDYETILDLNTQQGPVRKAGLLLSGEVADNACQKAYQMFCNDGFWLMAPFKITDPGTTRSVVTFPDGRKGLKVQYSRGGITPGDSYVWILDANGIPSTCKLWVSILPVGGVESSWERWITLPTGAKLSTYHLIGGVMPSEITNVTGGTGAVNF